jgi:hypothetical protein
MDLFLVLMYEGLAEEIRMATTIEKMDASGHLQVRLDSGRTSPLRSTRD